MTHDRTTSPAIAEWATIPARGGSLTIFMRDGSPLLAIHDDGRVLIRGELVGTNAEVYAALVTWAREESAAVEVMRLRAALRRIAEVGGGDYLGAALMASEALEGKELGR